MSTHQPSGVLGWLRHATADERKALVAGGLGWMLDAFDVMLYAMVLAHLMLHFGMDKATAGLLQGLTLLSSAVGGTFFGFFADRFGRARALMVSILIYSLASGACAFSQSILQLGFFRLILGLGMGGEWTAGAALVAETWRPQHRAKALALMQANWPIGEGLAALVAGLFLGWGTLTLGQGVELPAWRAVFLVGVLPALLVLWIRSGVKEPAIWREHRKARTEKQAHVPLRRLWQPDIRRNVIIASATSSAAMFGYWGLFTWIPAYLILPVEEGGRGMDIMQTTGWLLLMGVGKWLSHPVYGYVADAVGRRSVYIVYVVMAGLLVPLFVWLESPVMILLVGMLVGFFGSGHFTGFATIANEMFPTEIRATAVGLTYNFGRGFSALAPLVVGMLAERYGIGSSFLLTSVAFLLAGGLATLLPETKGTELR